MAHGINHVMIGQSMPIDTNPAVIAVIQSGTPREVIAKSIVISNNTDSDQEFSIFIPLNAITNPSQYGPANAIAYRLPIKARRMVCLEGYFPISNVGQTYAVQSSEGSALTFTFFGGSVPQTS